MGEGGSIKKKWCPSAGRKRSPVRTTLVGTWRRPLSILPPSCRINVFPGYLLRSGGIGSGGFDTLHRAFPLPDRTFNSSSRLHRRPGGAGASRGSLLQRATPSDSSLGERGATVGAGGVRGTPVPPQFPNGRLFLGCTPRQPEGKPIKNIFVKELILKNFLKKLKTASKFYNKVIFLFFSIGFPLFLISHFLESSCRN